MQQFPTIKKQNDVFLLLLQRPSFAGVFAFNVRKKSRVPLKNKMGSLKTGEARFLEVPSISSLVYAWYH
jgi:hypothetical protein